MTFSEIYEKVGAHRLPVDPTAAAKALGIRVMDYKTAVEIFEIDKPELYLQCPLGFSFKDGGELCIVLNENACGERRRRFTAAHELGHCVLGHLDKDVITPQDERAADRFAAEFLAPPAVLHHLNIRRAEDISRLCGISQKAAEICLERLAERERQGFNPTADELQIIKQLAIGS